MIDGENATTKHDEARLVTGWETLLYYDDDFKLQPQLATAVTQTAPDEYTIELRTDVEFHNGKTMTADDVIYSLKRMSNPKAGLRGVRRPVPQAPVLDRLLVHPLLPGPGRSGLPSRCSLQ